MKNIENKIKTEYHHEQLNFLKDKIPFKKNAVYVNKRSKLFIPSLVSLVSSFTILIVAVILFINSNVNDPNEHIIPENDNIAISHLESNTKNYLKTPIKTIFDNGNGLIISVYYGLKEDGNKLNHYLVFMYESEKNATLETKITSFYLDEGNESMDDAIFNESLDFVGEKVHATETIITDILVEITIKDEIFQFDLNLSEYYDFLMK